MAFSDLDLDKMQVEKSSPLFSSSTQQEQKKEPPTRAGETQTSGWQGHCVGMGERQEKLGSL